MSDFSWKEYLLAWWEWVKHLGQVIATIFILIFCLPLYLAEKVWEFFRDG